MSETALFSGVVVRAMEVLAMSEMLPVYWPEQTAATGLASAIETARTDGIHGLSDETLTRLAFEDARRADDELYDRIATLVPEMIGRQLDELDDAAALVLERAVEDDQQEYLVYLAETSDITKRSTPRLKATGRNRSPAESRASAMHRHYRK